MFVPPPVPQVPVFKKKSKGGGTCLIILCAGLIFLAFLIFVFPAMLRSMGVFGRSAEYLYQQAPDLVTGQQLQSVLDEHGVTGVSVYVIPVKGQNEKGAFIILDASRGYTGLDPLASDNDVFLELLSDLTERNRNENLRIAHLSVEYRDEAGNPLLAFTVDQQIVEKYARGEITTEDFNRSIEIDLMETMRRMGVEELLEAQP